MTTPGPTRSTLIGVFVLSGALLALEIALTRIFSVILWYHFAFLAISLALFGMAVGGLLLHFRPDWFPRDRVHHQMARHSMLFAIFVPIAYVLILGVPFVYRVSLPAAVSLLLIYTFAALPFLFGGLALALALSRFSQRIGLVYGMDLIGAGLGCLLVVPLLGYLTGPGVIVATAILAAVASLFFAASLGAGARNRRLLVLGVLVAVLVGHETKGWLRIDFSKDRLEVGTIHSDWNPLARITVTQEGTVNWATSEVYNGPKPETLWLKIDAEAGTPIVQFDGDFEKVKALQFDVSALVHTLRENAEVLVIGPGGGRDVLTALSFGQKRVTAVEINEAIISAVRDKFGDWSGGLYSRPDVRIVNDEGRSWVRRADERFDIIQASLIDTWAASSAGAYVLSENNLYTKEAFRDFLEHLNDDGILTMSRWYFKGRPIETLRLTGIAVAALRDLGITNPAAHIMVVKRSTWDWAYRRREFRDGVGTLLVKRTPWDPGEVAHIQKIAEDLKFDVVYAPGQQNLPEFEAIMGERRAEFEAAYPVDISAPVDDRPFFFYMLHARDAFRIFGGGEEIEQGVVQNNVRAIFVLVALLGIVLVLTSTCIMLPLFLSGGESFPRGGSSALYLLYFFCLGLGYLLVEIPLMQRFILLLGHPVNALTVVLFSMLVGSGAGSVLSNRIPERLFLLPAALIAVLVLVYAAVVPPILDASLALPYWQRVLLSVALLALPAVLMGMPFPLGVRQLSRLREGMLPWVWGVNGATSVCASVLATVFAIFMGYTAVLMIGAATYALAAVTLLLVRSREAREVRAQSAP